MNFYYHTLELPFSKKTIKFRELTTAEQLVLARLNLTLDNNTEKGNFEYFEFLNEILKKCILNYNDFLDLDIIEYTMFVTKLRAISIGNTIEFIVENQEKNIKQKINLNLNFFLKNLYQTTNSFFENDNNIVIDKQIFVKLKWPNLKNINTFLKANEMYLDSFMEFIDYIEVNNYKINFSNFELNQKREIVDKFSISFKQNIEKKVYDQLESLLSVNLLGIEMFKDQKFNIYEMVFVAFLRLFLSNDIKSIYSEIYYLSMNHLNPEYIYNISPSERKIYISIISESKSKSNDGEISASIGSNRTLEDLAVEFNQMQK